MSDLDFFGTTAKMMLRIAILGVSLGTVRLMPINNQVKVSQLCNSNTALQKYLKEGGNPDARLESTRFNSSTYYLNNYPLIFCVSDQGTEMLLKHGANPNIQVNGKTPLYNALISKNENKVKLLLKYDANPNLKTFNKDSLLHRAVLNGEEEIVKILLKNGADVNIKNRGKETPLDVAVRRYQVEIAEILLEKGAVANRQSRSRRLRNLRKKIQKLKLKRYNTRLRQIKQQRNNSSSN